MISQKLVDEVVIEATRLRVAATDDERSGLNFDTFNPMEPRSCIYGQMVGHCSRPRAVFLIKKCAATIHKVSPYLGLDEVECRLPKATKKEFVETRSKQGALWLFSPIEIYIAQEGADNQQLIDFLKGKRKTLDLSKTVNC